MIGARLGPYELRAELGSGGMATVYRAYQPTMDREVAVKVIHVARANDEAMRARFRREALLIARLEHPHILPIYDFDGTHDPPYIVMRYLNRGTLRELLATRSLTLAQVADLISQIASALDYAHRQGVVHRDIKPSNILLDRHGNAFVSDFGIARLVSTTGDGGQITGTGAIVGTPDYMSPEQAQGRAGIDGRADVYALGVLLFQMLTGRLPFVADQPMAVLIQHLQAPAPSARALNPSLPAGIDELLAHALAKSPADRPTSAGAFSGAFATLLRSARGAGRAATTQVLEERAVGATPTPPPREQQRIITAVAASAAEYVALVEEADGAEVARAALRALWERARSLIDTYGGRLITAGEHEVLVAWGVEAAHEHDTELAIRAALAIQAGLREQLGSRLASDEPLPLAVGVHTGPALVTLDASTSTLILSGRTITVAERLANQAEGTIRISQPTFRQVRGVFDVELDSPLKIRGATEPLETYRVIAAKAQAFRSRQRGVEGVVVPLIGRDPELRQLQDAFLTVIEEGETQVVTVLGEAGLGKTRLLDVFDEWADLRPERYWIFATQVTDAGRSQPYSVLRGLLGFRFSIRDGDSPADIRAKLEAGVAELLGAPDDATAQLVGYLAGFDLRDAPHVRGLQSDPRQLVELARERFVQLVVRLCAAAPIVMVIDDLHHADEASVELLTQLSERTDIPLLIILAARPGLLERTSDWGADQRVHQRITLRPLDRRASREMVRALLAPLAETPKDLRDLLVERSAGNPLYLEELVHMLLDERVIVRLDHDRWRLEPQRLSQLTVPPTLYGLLQARLDTLLIPEQITLQRASVLGQIFTVAPLDVLDAADDSHLADTQGPIQTLVARGFLERRSDTPIPGEAAFAFSQALLRDLIYETLLDRRRRSFHLAFATWLVERGPARHSAALIADHYERGAAPAEAARWYVRAGQHARETHAVAAAIQQFQTALALLPDMPESASDRVACHEGLGQALRESAHLADAVASFALMAAAAGAAGDRAAEARAHNLRAETLDDACEYQGAWDSARRAIAIAEEAGASGELARGLRHLAFAEMRFERAAEARALAERALAIMEGLGDTEGAALCMGLLGLLDELGGDYAGAMRRVGDALEAYRALGNRAEVATQLNNLGYLANMQGDYAGALAFVREGLAISQAIGSRVGEIFLLSNIGFALSGLGDHAGAEAESRRGIELSELARMPVMADFYCALSEALLSQGQAVEALEAAQHTLDIARRNESPREVAAAWRALGRAISAMGDPAEASRCFEESASAFTAIEAKGELGRTLRAWAEHELRSGNALEGRGLWDRARALFAQVELTHELARTPELGKRAAGNQ